jgi:hypothetical protein
MRAAPSPPRALIAVCWFLTAACVPMAGEERVVDLSGTYQGRAPAADPARRVYTLTLAADGTAILTTLYIGRNDTMQHGHWTRKDRTRRDRQVVLTFDDMGTNPAFRPIVFRHRGHQLTPIAWDASEWGRAGPPVLYRSRPAQGGF